MDDKFLENVVGCVEANSFERHCLWLHFAEEARMFECGQFIRYRWEQNSSGYLETVGTIDNRCVCISILTDKVDGKKLLFWFATSEAVDYQLIDQWLQKYLTAEAYANKSDATNFHNVL